MTRVFLENVRKRRSQSCTSGFVGASSPLRRTCGCSFDALALSSLLSLRGNDPTCFGFAPSVQRTASLFGEGIAHNKTGRGRRMRTKGEDEEEQEQEEDEKEEEEEEERKNE